MAFFAETPSSHILSLSTYNSSTTLNINDYIVAADSHVGTISYTLPSITDVPAGKIYIFKDESGGASFYNIAVKPALGESLDGTTNGSSVINSDYGSVSIYSNGTDWHTLNTYTND